ncbi:MAG: hypothetical protein NC204_07805 [Candidatus Amulumruptor caecigallinarius]|nr:hypothetical protein [Candidatus Amulumruptor caecigallinarius]
MANLVKSKITAWVAMALVVTLIVLTFLLHMQWWTFIAEFFAFLAVFSHLAALYLGKMSRAASSKLETIAFICCILAVIGVIVLQFCTE